MATLGHPLSRSARNSIGFLLCAILHVHFLSAQGASDSAKVAGSPTQPPVAGAQNAPTAAGIIRGTFNTVAVDPTGKSKTLPENLSLWTIAAWVQDQNDRYVRLTGKGNADGVFTIADVPKGSYWLEYGCGKCSPAIQPEFDEISTRQPALGYYVAVTRGNLKPAAQGVALNFNLTGLPCFPPEAKIEWSDFNWWVPNVAASQAVGTQKQVSYLNPCENPGVFSGAARWSGPLMNTASGDAGYLLGYAFAVDPDPEIEYWDEVFVAAGYGSEPLTTPDGKSLDITGAASTPSIIGPDVRYSSFVALEKSSWSATSCTALP